MKLLRYGWFVFLVVGICFLVGCTTSAMGDQSSQKEKIQVYASFYPLADFAEKIGGHYVEVTNMVPAGVEPHDFEPSPKQMSRLSEADVFIYNGAGLEGWVDKVKPFLDTKRTVIVNSTRSIQLHPSEESHKEEHDHGVYDPHVWLDPVLAKQQAAAIRDGLIQADPKHEKAYRANYKRLEAGLNDLHHRFQEIANRATKHQFIVSHAAFGYLAKRYGWEQIPVSGLSPEDEPTAKELEKITDIARKHAIHYILFETLVNGKAANAVKKEIGAESLTLNPVEGLTQKERDRGEDYFSMMKKNAESLEKALEAQPN
ncbi:zinc ABC transporter substrate-binding protein [Polycladomyces sp. WAk]|uniref:Zinc ABC transporter substrate-binding protein n=1 Tax=Polycladomyces zharkentensis TaxID=2807616 RepID=A0ABS2WKP3_9BACL|nr:metal ABC transporter substrate-binding protein [Polycladomyces sp. WAk]MBN2910099.1 zinc ABC transporter substrate-binding protein [Polycladomyces sp. WAk]